MYAPGAGDDHDIAGGRAVIARAWTIHSRPAASIAHSTSCGVPAVAAITRAAIAMRRTSRAVTARSGVRRAVAFRPRTTHSSPAVRPETSRSPRPRTAVTTHDRRSPVIGSAVSATPAARATTIRWTMTAIRSPAARSYARTRPSALARTRSTASGTSSSATPSTDSYIPANDRSSPSSPTALERTANGPGPSARAAARSAATGSSSPAAEAPSATLSTNPSGTRTPLASSSPRRAALPPTSVASPARTSRSRRIAPSIDRL